MIDQAKKPAKESPFDFEVSKAEIALWRERLKEAEAEAKPFFEQADVFRKEWLTKYYPATKDAPVRLSNYIASYLQVFEPTLYFQDPTVYLEPTKPGQMYDDCAKLVAARINDLLRPMHFSDSIEEALQDSFFCVGVLMVNYASPTPQRRKLKIEDGDVKEVRTVDTDTAEMGYDEFYEAGQPAVMHIDFRDLIVDPSATSLSKAGWLKRRVYRKLEDLKIDDRYEVPDDLQASHTWKDVRGKKAEGYGSSGPGGDPLNQWVELQEIWIDGGRKVITLAEGYEDAPLRAVKVKNGIEGFPFVLLRLQRVNGQLYPQSPFAVWFELHKATNDLKAHLNELAKSIKNLMFVDQGAGEKLKRAIEDAKSGDILMLDHLRDVISAQMLNLPPELQAQAETLKNDMDRISGISDFVRGMASQGGVTATEIAKITEKYEIRIARAQSRVIAWVEDVLSMVGAVVFNYSVETIPVRMDVAGKRQWGEFSPDNLAGEYLDYAFKIETQSHTRRDPEARQKRNEQLIALLSNPFVQQTAAKQGILPNILWLIEDWMDAGGIRDKSNVMVPLQPQVAGVDPAMAGLQQIRPDVHGEAEAWQENQALLATGQMPPPANGQQHEFHEAVHDKLAGLLQEAMDAGDVPMDTVQQWAQVLGEHVGQHMALAQQDAQMAQQQAAQQQAQMQAQAMAGQQGGQMGPQGAAPGPMPQGPQQLNPATGNVAPAYR